jgi:hypothetical protein
MRVPGPIHHIPQTNPQRPIHERPRHPAQRRLFQFQAALRDGRRAGARVGLHSMARISKYRNLANGKDLETAHLEGVPGMVRRHRQPAPPERAQTVRRVPHVDRGGRSAGVGGEENCSHEEAGGERVSEGDHCSKCRTAMYEKGRKGRERKGKARPSVLL